MERVRCIYDGAASIGKQKKKPISLLRKGGGRGEGESRGTRHRNAFRKTLSHVSVHVLGRRSIVDTDIKNRETQEARIDVDRDKTLIT